jgi:hypothetical protein
MTCPFCGHTLGFLTEVLAFTQSGSQCPKCWSRVSPERGTPPNRSHRRPVPLKTKTPGHRISAKRLAHASR